MELYGDMSIVDTHRMNRVERKEGGGERMREGGVKISLLPLMSIQNNIQCC